MGCFALLRCRKKIYDQLNTKAVNVNSYKSDALTESRPHAPSLQSAPPSFRTRASRPVVAFGGVTNTRARALSAPSTLDVVGNIVFCASEFDEQEDFKGKGSLPKELRFSTPLPLPLPSPGGNAVLKHVESFKLAATSSPIPTSGPLPLPPLGGTLRKFSYEEISAACQHFSGDRCVSEGISSTVYKATIGGGDDSRVLEATVTRLLPSSQGLKDFVSEVSMIASLQHPQLCRLLGFHAREAPDQKMLVYERLCHGSLDRLLYGRSDGPSISWSMRMKIALCAAKGLVYLHEEGPFQAMYNEFSTANIQIAKDFSAKLSGYGCVSHDPEMEISNPSAVAANLSIETLERGLLTPKSNVWCFGIVLLELLTGRKNYDPRNPKQERNIVKWSRPFLSDDCRLTLIMDPRIKGRCPPKAARTVADIVLRCLQKDPSDRPTMRAVAESLETVQAMKYPSRFPLQDPSEFAAKEMLRLPSFGGGSGASSGHPLNLSSSPTSRSRPSFSPPSAAKKSQLPVVRRPRVEGF